MPSTIRLTCPICGTRERMPIVSPLRLFGFNHSGRISTTSNINSAVQAATASICPDCDKPFGVIVHQGGNALLANIFSGVDGDKMDHALNGAIVMTVPTGAYHIEEDQSLPEQIRKAFVFIQEDAVRRRNAPGIMSGARACLDVTLKELGQADGGRKTRINSLAAQGIITSALADWAQTLWTEGSDAVHDLTADIDRAIEHVEFLKLLFEVVFGLPARIQAASHTASE